LSSVVKKSRNVASYPKRTVKRLAGNYIHSRFSATGGGASFGDIRWNEKAGLQRDALSSQVIDALKARETRRPAMKKLTTTTMQETLHKHDRHLTVGLDLGDRSTL
jgi:hypothetical protein